MSELSLSLTGGTKNVAQDDTVKPTAFIGSSRFAFTMVLLVGLALFYALRVDMSVAILCMVNHTAVNQLEALSKQQSNQTLLANLTSVNSTMKIEAMNPNCVRSGPRGAENQTTGSRSEDGPFVWDSLIQNQILGSFFFGYLVLQAPGGFLASAIGGRWVIFSSVLALAVFTVALPFAASSWIAVAVFRALQGLASSAVIPAVQAMMSQWAPPLERSKIATLAYSGIQLGNVFAFPVSGILCRYLRWEFVFYFWGGITFTWLALWFFFGHNKPSEHPRITEAEKIYITRSIGSAIGGKTKMTFCSIPWLAILKSPPFWGNLVANFTSDWGAYTFLSQTPRYMKSVHNFDIASNSSISALPYIFYWLVITVSGPLADLMRVRNWLSTIWTRRVFAITGFMLPSGFLIILGYLSCEYWVLALIVLILVVSLSGLQYASWCVSLLDVAPKYAGFLWGITNTVACVSGVGTNAIAGLMMSATPTLAEWRLLFFVTAGVMAFGCFVYCACVRSEVETWASDGKEDRAANVKADENVFEESIPLKTMKEA